MDSKYQFTKSKREQMKFPYKCVRKACNVRTCIIHKICCGSTIEVMKVTFPIYAFLVTVHKENIAS